MNANESTLGHCEAARLSLSAIFEQLQEVERQAVDGQCAWTHAGSAAKVAEDLRELETFFCPADLSEL